MARGVKDDAVELLKISIGIAALYVVLTHAAGAVALMKTGSSTYVNGIHALQGK